jgi:mRNA interferase MazF
MRRGEICLVDLAPTRGAEANKSRPAVIMSNDGADETRGDLAAG